MPTFELIEESTPDRPVQMQAVRPRPAAKAPTEPTFELVGEVSPPQPSGGVMNVLKQIPGGATAALVEVGQTLKEAGDFIRDSVPLLKELDPGDQFQVPIPQFEEPQGAVAGVVKSATQFLTAFLPFSKLAKGVGITGAFAKGMTAGALADLTAFDPDDPKLSDMINELAPSLKNPITEYLASDPTDSSAEKRMKRMLEGAGLGVLTEAVFRSIKAISAARKAKTLRVAEQMPDQLPASSGGANLPESPVGSNQIGEVPSGGGVSEDLQANFLKESVEPNPPVPRLATTPVASSEPLPKYAGSINLERMQTDDGVKRAIVEASEAIPKRAPITADESIELAASLGYTLDDAEKLATATQAQRHGAKAARDVLAATAEAYDQARTVFAASQSPADFAKLKSAETAFLRAFNATQKIASEMGFGLQSFRQTAKADLRSVTEKQINKLLAQLLNKGPIADEITKRLAALDKTNPEEIHTFLEYLSTKTATTPDKLFEAFLASILSGPQTHAANLLGNFANVAIRPIERVVTAGVDLFLSPIKSRDRFFGEAAVDMMGIVGAFDDAVRGFSRTMRTGMASFGTKFEVAEAGAKIGGKAGHIIRTPLRFLSASDEFFKILAQGGDLRAQAYRLGVKRGLKGKALRDFTIDLSKSPTEEMIKASQNEAAYRTFTKELGEKGQRISLSIRSLPGVRYLAPFVRTPINIAKFGLERTPLKAFDLLRMAAKGKLVRNGEMSEEVGKLAIGVGLQAWVASQVIAGNITGSGPGDPADRSALLKTGWQPQSLRLFGEYHSYSRLEPFATALGIMADATELVQAGLESGAISEIDKDELVNNLMAIVVQNISDKTFLQGLTDTSNVLSDPGRYFARWSQQRVRALIPNVIGQAARAQDPQVRRITDMYDAIRAQLPKIGDFEGRQGLYPVRDYFGEPVEQQGNFWYRYLVPIRTSRIESTPTEERIAEVGARILPLGKTILMDNTKVELTPEEYDRYQVLAGKWAKITVEGIAGGIASLTYEQQREMIEDAFARGRKIGRTMMKAELRKTHPELKDLR